MALLNVFLWRYLIEKHFHSRNLPFKPSSTPCILFPGSSPVPPVRRHRPDRGRDADDQDLVRVHPRQHGVQGNQQGQVPGGGNPVQGQIMFIFFRSFFLLFKRERALFQQNPKYFPGIEENLLSSKAQEI